MRSVNIAELKNRLSTYLTYAKERRSCRHQGSKSARRQIDPFAAEDASEEELALVAAGAMRLPEKPLDLDQLWMMPRQRSAEMPRSKQFWMRGTKAGEPQDRFWDSSALIPLCVQEGTAIRLRRWQSV